MLIDGRFETVVPPRRKRAYRKMMSLGHAASDAWSATVLSNGSGRLSWNYIAEWAAQTALAFGMDEQAVTYAATSGLLPAYDANDDPVTLATHRNTTLAPLGAWTRCGPDWVLAHRAGLTLAESIAVLSKPKRHPDRLAMEVLAGLRGSAVS